MLSEAWRLRQALKRSKFTIASKHPRLKTPGRSMPCLRIRLQVNGQVSVVESVSEDNRPNWTIMEGNQNSFPVVRAKSLLTSAATDWPLQDHAGNNRQQLQSWWDKHKRSISVDASLWQRLHDNKAKELKDCSNGNNSLTCFASRFLTASQDANALLTSVGDQIVTSWVAGALTDDKVVGLFLVGQWSKKTNKFETATVQLAFDIDTGSVYSSDVAGYLTEHLPSVVTATAATANGIDAITGQEAELEDSCFPKVDLPTPSGKTSKHVGRKSFPLSSMFSAAECNYRYGMTDTAVFPIGRANAIQLKEAVEAITADNYKDKTWSHVPSGRFTTQNGRKVEKRDLLIVYAEEQPDIHANAAAFFGTGPDTTETQFVNECQAVCQSLQGLAKTHPTSKLQLLVIREMSKGQAQIALAEAPTVQSVLASATTWQQAAANIPDIKLWMPANKKTNRDAGWASPTPPYPGQVVALLAEQWIRDGQDKRQLPGVGLAEVLWIMLRTPGKWEDAARCMVTMAVQRLPPLLIGVFGAKHAYAGKQVSYHAGVAPVASLQAAAVLGILLDALDRKKEHYMLQPVFQVGQVLALADTLHKDYCTVVRGGQLPNTLIGTALMRRAMDSPVGAVADLAERMIEYIRWAKTAAESGNAKDDDPKRIAVREARKTLRRYQSLAAALGNHDLPKECSDLDKAELLLGFLASPQDMSTTEKDIDHDE